MTALLSSEANATLKASNNSPYTSVVKSTKRVKSLSEINTKTNFLIMIFCSHFQRNVKSQTI